MECEAKVLLVDDDPGLLKALSDLLEDAGYQVVTAHDGQSGLAAALEHRPDVALLDVIMARPDEGFVLARALHAEQLLGDVKVIMLTAAGERYGMAFEPDQQWLPVDRVLEKPITGEELIEEIERLL
jgi:CheY-like chemotaxis protein